MASSHGASVRPVTANLTPATDDTAAAVRVMTVDASGAYAAAGGGTQYTEGDTDATITGTAVMWEDTGDTLRAASAAKPLPVNIISGSTAATEYTEDAAAPTNPTGGTLVMRRNDSPNGTTVSADGDWMALQGNSSGCVYVAFNPNDAPAVGVTGTVAISDGAYVTEDNASDPDPIGPVHIGRRRDSLVAETGTDGDYIALNATNKGELYVKHVDSVPVTDNGGSLTVDGTVAATQSGTWNVGTVTSVTNVVHVDDNASTLSVDDGGGSLTVDGTVAATQSGTWTVQPGNTANTTAWKVDASSVAVPVTDNSGSLTVDNAGTFAVQDSQVIADNAGFTDGTSKVFAAGFIYDEVAGTALTENDAAAARINVNRAQVATIEDGATRGRYATVSASNALKVDGSAVTQPVSGTVTANLAAGTNNIGDVDVLTVPAPLSTTGGGTEATALRVTVASDSTGVLSVDDNGSTLSIDDGAGSITVDGTVAATQSGTWTVQPGNTANTTAWKVDASSVAVPVTDNSGSLTIDTAYLEVSGSGSALNATPIASTDVGSYSFVSLEVYGTFSASIQFEASADNSTFYAQHLERTDIPGIYSNSWGASGFLLVGVPAARYFRVRISSYSSGTVSCRAIFRATAPLPRGAKADGTYAHDAVDGGNPLKIGGRAITASPTAVAAADRTDVVADVYGRPFVRAGHQWVAGSIWTATHVPAANTQATATKASAGAGVRNVCTALTVSLVGGSSAPSAAQVSVAVIDGASGGGTYLWRSVMSIPAVAGQSNHIVLTNLWLPGTAATAMTIEFSAAGGANTVESVWMSGTTVAE